MELRKINSETPTNIPPYNLKLIHMEFLAKSHYILEIIFCKILIYLTHTKLNFLQFFLTFLYPQIKYFQFLLERIRPAITKQTTRMRRPIRPEEKLAVTLRYLATGESFASLQYQFRISKSAISRFVPVVCMEIYNSLFDEYLKMRANED